MKIGIITPMAEEKQALMDAIEGATDYHYTDLTVTVGQYAGHDIYLAESGIGKVAAATATTMLIQVFHVDQVINTGSAGGIDPDLKIGDSVIASELTYFDADTTVFGNAYGQLPNQPARFESDPVLVKQFHELTGARTGLIVTGDSFVQEVLRQHIVRHFPETLVAEMEGAAVAQVANRFQVPFIVLRGVSDQANGESNVDFDIYVAEAGRASAKLLLTYLAKV
ncbi:5'-methylthioadenosine/adenosylhomocysteine nucleosidase [Leuconostocaceae bacterium ESL0958]|nr:5'-methylthioadenosine/adenosylhomocysteine nucleosidase [Leuconostocaceae bacterium ESL0958]